MPWVVLKTRAATRRANTPFGCQQIFIATEAYPGNVFSAQKNNPELAFFTCNCRSIVGRIKQWSDCSSLLETRKGVRQSIRHRVIRWEPLGRADFGLYGPGRPRLHREHCPARSDPNRHRSANPTPVPAISFNGTARRVTTISHGGLFFVVGDALNRGSLPRLKAGCTVRHIFAITAFANSLHLTSLAPSIKRAKSYVTVRAVMAPSMPLMIRSAASVQPM